MGHKIRPALAARDANYQLVGLIEMTTPTSVLPNPANVGVEPLARPRSPYDQVFFYDSYNDLAGPIEVEQVTHIFSSEIGKPIFRVRKPVNTISPALRPWVFYQK
jgi:hypothetical protein